MILEKLITYNTLFDTIIGSTIVEYDMKSAGSTAIRSIKGESIYNELMSMDKKTRNIKIGLMMKNTKGLSKKVNEFMLKYLNLFIKENKIKKTNFIYSTRDSIVIYNKIPMKTKFDNVEFVNKDGIFSSMFRIKQLTLFFDSMSGRIIAKGINDEVVKKSTFLQRYLVKFLYTIESCQKSGDAKVFNTLRHMRDYYIRSNNTSIYRDVMNENKLGIRYNNELIYVENELELDSKNEEFSIAKDLNYTSIVLPIMRSVLLNG